MTEPVHVVADLGVLLVLAHMNILNINYTDAVLIVGSNLVDIDHLFSRPIYLSGRDSFKTHFLHKQWKIISVFINTYVIC